MESSGAAWAARHPFSGRTRQLHPLLDGSRLPTHHPTTHTTRHPIPLDNPHHSTTHTTRQLTLCPVLPPAPLHLMLLYPDLHLMLLYPD